MDLCDTCNIFRRVSPALLFGLKHSLSPCRTNSYTARLYWYVRMFHRSMEVFSCNAKIQNWCIVCETFILSLNCYVTCNAFETWRPQSIRNFVAVTLGSVS